MQEYVKGFVTNPLFGVFTGLLGVWGGYRLNILKDRRIEYNEAAEILFQELRNKVFRPDFEKFSRRLGWYRRCRFNYFVEEYHTATETNGSTTRDTFGRPINVDVTRIEEARNKLIKFTKRI